MSKSSMEASEEAKELWRELWNVIRSEDAWEIIDNALDKAKASASDGCGCHVGRQYGRIEHSPEEMRAFAERSEG